MQAQCLASSLYGHATINVLLSSNKGGARKKEKKEQQELKFRKKSIVEHLAPPFMAVVLTLSSPVSFDQPALASEGGRLFQKACIGCHDTGGNILQPGATLFKEDLERNGVNTEEEIYNVTYYGKRRMPGYGEKCSPKGQCTFGPRLQDDEIKMLAEFVKSQAESGWPKVESYED
ncbi:cytochrome c6 protein [Dioscorea alata]|uniref:Cytochrome c6 protein n=1 Tax=Dioscorea alata TaxID=55571 RepID=A0ACB7UMH3_DIOAL|nr:cytochrome c6 protein [Dioscorea alata]